MNLPAKVTISGFTQSCGEGGVTIQINDAISNTRIVEVTMTHQQFGLCVVGRGHCDGEMNLTPDHAGKIHEHKTELIEWKGQYDDKPSKYTTLKPFELDGWHGDISDLGNSHKREKNNHYRVTFHRYVTNK